MAVGSDSNQVGVGVTGSVYYHARAKGPRRTASVHAPKASGACCQLAKPKL
ncbi:uncharacterized protein PITG_20408 [Phytophthora infestans T30-4]|uniref:Uncharacterized protein n=1 Tax=Phytophthora infestans (strain T30-4) TaxID=403677 RepID=D0P2R6_PHYIT|nr:uncharacterized protein PITG_20408 [Phytophthora infestans T30-4]EEY56732.1 conserved hypothetical protein [Phytophthora infestans T30-4]|eukprot:XP_002895409.1 conserved hypothetical protein [Phytophthora infestans T30-4]